MNPEDLFSLKKEHFWKRIETFDDFVVSEQKKGNLMGRIGTAPVGPVQLYTDPLTGITKEVVVFGSNSYLGFSNNPEIKEKVKKAIDQYGLGSGGSPAFSGFMKNQRELEFRLSKLSGHEDALLVAGGYIANLTWISSLIEKEDVIIYDKNSHASTVDAIKLCGVRHAFNFNTDKPETLKMAITQAKKKYSESQIFVTVEGVRSVDGSVADVKSLLEICKSYDEKIFFMLDDAHGLGTLGEHGHGSLEYLNLKGKVDLRMSTCSKAMGIQGAFLTGSPKVIQYMRTLANPYTYTTAMSQPVIAAINAGLDYMEEHPEILKKLHTNKEYMWKGLESTGFNFYKAPSGIIPIFIKGAPCEAINRELFMNGLFANVFFYPFQIMAGCAVRNYYCFTLVLSPGIISSCSSAFFYFFI